MYFFKIEIKATVKLKIRIGRRTQKKRAPHSIGEHTTGPTQTISGAFVKGNVCNKSIEGKLITFLGKLGKNCSTEEGSLPTQPNCFLCIVSTQRKDKINHTNQVMVKISGRFSHVYVSGGKFAKY